MGTTQVKNGFQGGSDDQLLVNPDGSINVDIIGTVPISGTVTANQGTTPWVDNVAQFGGNNVVTGTGTSGLGIPRVTVSNDSNILATQSGLWDVSVNNFPSIIAVTQSTSPWVVSGTVLVSNFPTTVDTNYGTVGASTIRTASQIGNATGAADFNAGATGAQTLRVTANAGVNLNTSALALDTSVNGILLSQGSTTSGQFGPLIQGAVTTSAPTYVTGKTDPLSLTTAGALRIDGSGTTQPISGTVTVSGQTFDSASALYVDFESQKDTYSAAILQTIAANPTDVFTIIGSGTKLIRIHRIAISGTNTANTNAFVSIAKRSTADSGGTSTVVASVPVDSTQAAGTAVVRSYSANPTLGTLVGLVRTDILFLPTLASSNSAIDLVQIFGVTNTKSLVLRGTSESVVVNLGGATLGGTTVLGLDITWTEE
jgi:hypothetical protein